MAQNFQDPLQNELNNLRNITDGNDNQLPDFVFPPPLYRDGIYTIQQEIANLRQKLEQQTRLLNAQPNPQQNAQQDAMDLTAGRRRRGGKRSRRRGGKRSRRRSRRN